MKITSKTNPPKKATIGSLAADAWADPILALEEEIELTRAFQNTGNRMAADMLIRSHVRLVFKIASKYRTYGMPYDDLVSEGNIGLIKALQKFDPDRGFRFSTYARWWIRAAIVEYVIASWSLVRLGSASAQKKLFFRLRWIKNQLQEMEDGELSDATATQIATMTGATEREVVHFNRRFSCRDSSLNAPISENGTGQVLDLLIDEQPSPEQTLERSQQLGRQKFVLAEAIETLPERERKIFVARRLAENRPTLKQLGAQYGISRERIRQLENRAFHQVQSVIERRMKLPMNFGMV